LKPFIRPIVYILGLLLFLYSIYYLGQQSIQKKWDIEKAEQTAQVEIVEKIVEKEVIKYVDKIKIVKEKGDVIIQKVPEFITVESNANCTIPNGFVRLHDAGVQNTNPGEPRETDGAASGIALTAVTETVVQNYTTCNGFREHILSLQNALNLILRR
jgi:hypothetical protein